MSRPGRATWDSYGTLSTAASSSRGIPPPSSRWQSDRPPTYLRATVLDDFRNDKWEIGRAPSGRFARARGRSPTAQPDTRERDGDRSGRHASRRRQHPDAIRGRRRRAARQARAGFRRPQPEPPAGLPVHGLELRGPPDPGRLAPLAPGLPDGAGRTRAAHRRRRPDGAAVRFSEPPHRDARAPDSPRPLRVRCRSRVSRSGWPATPGLRTTRSRSSSNGSSPPARSTTRTTRP